MRPFLAVPALALAVAFLAAVPGVAQSPAPAVPGEASAVYARMQHVNATLKSFEADLHVDVTTHGFPYVSPSLDGKAYFRQPDQNAVIFESVPVLASAFRKVYPQLEPPAEWPRIYEVTQVADDGTTAQFRLVRKKNGRIDHVDVVVDDKTATVTSMAYVYKDGGGSISFQQSYVMLDGNYVLKSQTGKVAIAHYNADVASTFSNYRLNVKIDDKIFATE